MRLFKPGLKKRIPVKIDVASTYLSSLVSGSKNTSVLLIEMGKANLSDWFALYIHYLFSELQETGKAEDDLLDAVANLHVNKLRHDIHFLQNGNVRFVKEIHSLELKNAGLMTTSFFDIRKIEEQQKSRTKKIDELKCKMDNFEGNLLPLFLLIESMVSLIEADASCSENASVLKSKIMNHPLGYLHIIAAMMSDIVKIAEDVDSDSVNARMDNVINDILRLMDCNVNDEALVINIREAVFKKEGILQCIERAVPTPTSDSSGRGSPYIVL